MLRANIGRLVLAVLCGYVLGGAIVAIVERLFLRQMSSVETLATDLAVVAVAAVVSGVVGCQMAPPPRWVAAACMSVLWLIFRTITVKTMWKTIPHWYGITLLAIYPPFVFLGEKLSDRN
jgi:hypothetical protein